MKRPSKKEEELAKQHHGLLAFLLVALGDFNGNIKPFLPHKKGVGIHQPSCPCSDKIGRSAQNAAIEEVAGRNCRVLYYVQPKCVHEDV